MEDLGRLILERREKADRRKGPRREEEDILGPGGFECYSFEFYRGLIARFRDSFELEEGKGVPLLHTRKPRGVLVLPVNSLQNVVATLLIERSERSDPLIDVILRQLKAKGHYLSVTPSASGETRVYHFPAPTRGMVLNAIAYFSAESYPEIR